MKKENKIKRALLGGLIKHSCCDPVFLMWPDNKHMWEWVGYTLCLATTSLVACSFTTCILSVRVFFDCRTEPRRSMRSSSRTACKAAASVIAQALDRRKRPLCPLALSCLSINLTAAAAVSPCVDANHRRDGAAVDEARVQRNGRELQSDYLVARGETGEREQKIRR